LRKDQVDQYQSNKKKEYNKEMNLTAQIPELEYGETQPQAFIRHRNEIQQYDRRILRVFVPEFIALTVFLYIIVYFFVPMVLFNVIVVLVLWAILFEVTCITHNKLYLMNVTKRCFALDDSILHAIEYLPSFHQSKVIDILNMELYTIIEDKEGTPTGRNLTKMRQMASDKFVDQLNGELEKLARKRNRRWTLCINPISFTSLPGK